MGVGVRLHAPRRKECRWLCLVLVVFAAFSSAEDQLETVVVTGSFSPSPLSEMTASTTVIDYDELQRLNKQLLSDVLRTVPGLLIEEQGGGGGLTSVSIRGGEANFTQILLDGVALNDPTNSRGGSHDLRNINPYSVARIEIVRGPQSAVYGSDAMAGVVNIISLDPRESRPATLRMEMGERGYRDYGFSASSTMDQLGVAIDLSSRESGEVIEGSRRDIDTVGVRARWQPSQENQLSLQVRHLEGERSSYPEQSGGPLFAVSDALDAGDFRQSTVALGWDSEFGPRWQSRLSGSYFSQAEDYRSPGVFPYSSVPANGSETDFEREQLSWVNTLKLAQSYQLNLGADYRDEQGNSAGYVDVGVQLPTDYRLARKTTGAFLELRAQPLEALLLQSSVRYDSPDSFDDETTVRLGARFALSSSVTLLTNWGEGFKLPSFFALGHGLVGNPELLPETVSAWDAGIEWQALQSVEITTSAFFNAYDDLIDFDPEAFTNVNRRRVESKGVEWLVHWRPADALTAKMHATYTDIEVVGEDVMLLGRPEWKAGAWLDWQLTPQWRLGFDYAWNGAVPASSLHTGQSVVSVLDDYHRLDWRLSWQPAPVFNAELAVDNLLDANYETAVGFPAPGRMLRLALTWQYGG